MSFQLRFSNLTFLFFLSTAIASAGCSSSASQSSKGDSGSGDDAGVDSGDLGDAQSSPATCGDAGVPGQVQTLYSGQQIMSLTTGSGGVFWSEGCGMCNGTTGTLWTQPLAGGSPTQLLFPVTAGGAASTPLSLLVDGSTLWFTNFDGLHSIGVDGSHPQIVAPGSALHVFQLTGIAVDADDVYGVARSNAWDTVVLSVSKTTGAVTTLATVPHAAPVGSTGLVADATRLYWPDHDDASGADGIFAVPKAGGSAALLITVPGASGAAIAMGSGDGIYIVGGDQTLRLVHTGQPAAAPVTVATSVTAPIVAAGDQVYFLGTMGSTPSIQRACAGGDGATVAALSSGDATMWLATSSDQLFIAGTTGNGGGALPGGALWSAMR
jgi:hypothetical protein